MSERDRPDSEIEIEIDGKTLSFPRAAFEEGRQVLNLMGGDVYTERIWYRDSIQAFFAALKRDGFLTIQL
jgi:hypothetical protein